MCLLGRCASATAEPPEPSAPSRAAVPAGINDRWVAADGEDAARTLEREGREVYEARHAILKALAIQAGQAVADVGAGSGLFTRLFADAVGATGTVYAVDIGARLLASIAAEAEKTGRHQVKTVLGTDRSTRLAPGSVDLIFVSDTYHHFEYPQAMLRSMHQALRPNGRLAVVDFKRIEGESPKWVLGHVRAGQEVVVREIEAEGFRRTESVEIDGLRENYFIVFEKIDA